MTDLPLWQWRELCSACQVPAVDGPDISGISIDSRSLSPGDLFIALSGDPGPRFHSSGSSGKDGHEFIDAAIEAGAAGVMVSRDLDLAIPTLRVADTLDGLWQLGASRRTHMHGRVVAITGSGGKTTARQWLEQLLMGLGRPTHASTGSLNNHWGVPLSLARMPRQSEFGIFEIGTNNPGEIAPLSKLVMPHIALVLNVLPAHLGRFPSLEAIRLEKLSIADGLVPTGVMVIPETLPHSEVASKNLITFGLGTTADVAGRVEYGPDFADVEVTIGAHSTVYRLPTTGEHRVLTSLAICAVLNQLGINIHDAVHGFSGLTIPSGRGNVRKAGGVVLVDDSYNANPVSMRYALEALGTAEGQKVAILGEMLELGEEGRVMHQEIAGHCRELDGVVTVGEGFASWPNGAASWGHFESAADIDVISLANRLEPGAHVLIKGSNKVFWTSSFVAKLASALESRD